MKMKIFIIHSLIIFLGIFINSEKFSHADFSLGSLVETVQSVPLETTLTAPGIKLTQQVWLDIINSAQHSIDIEQFYINNKAGESLEPVLKAIHDAAARDVQIRFIVDSKFYKTYPDQPNILSQVKNIQVRTIDFSSTGGIQHSKYFVADQSDAYVGSANFDWLALSHIHEVGLHIKDSKTGSSLESIFEADWATATPLQKNLAQFAVDDSVVVVASPVSKNPSGLGASLNAIIQSIDTARKSLRIQMYEYNTRNLPGKPKWTLLDSAIRRAAARGVRVQIAVDVIAMKAGSDDLKSLASVKNVEVRTITIPQWSGGHLDYARLVHSKYFTVDDTSGWVGSENWSLNYFIGSRNVGLIFQSSEINRQLNSVFDQVWNSNYTNLLGAN